MARNVRKELLESLLSQTRDNVAVRTANSPFQGLIVFCRCCIAGDWKLATMHFTESMNHAWTNIVNPNAGVNRKP